MTMSVNQAPGQLREASSCLKPQTSKNRLTAPPYVAARPAILSSRDRSIAGYS